MASIKLRTITCLKCDMPENLDAAEYFEHYGQFHLDLQVFKCGGCKRSFSTYFFAALHRCKGEKKVELIADENEKETQCKLLALQKGLNDSLKTQFEQATQYFKNYVSEQLAARMEEDNKEMEAAAQQNETQSEERMEEGENEPEKEAEKKPENEPEVEASAEPEPEAEVEPEKQGGLEEGEIPDTDDEQKPDEPPAAPAASTSYHSMIDSDDEMEEQDSVGEEDEEEEDEHLTDFIYGGRPEEFSRRRSSCEEPEEKRPRLQEPVADSEAVENIDTAKIKQILDKPEVLEILGSLKTLDPTKLLNIQKEPEIDATKAKELQEVLNNLEAAKLLKLQKEKEIEDQNNAAAAPVKERHDSLDSTNFDDLEEVDEVGEDDVQIHLGDDNEEGTLYIPATPSEKADITVTIDDDYRLNGRISFPGRAAGKN